jgi:hypothetical protein
VRNQLVQEAARLALVVAVFLCLLDLALQVAAGFLVRFVGRIVGCLLRRGSALILGTRGGGKKKKSGRRVGGARRNEYGTPRGGGCSGWVTLLTLAVLAVFDAEAAFCFLEGVHGAGEG